MMWLRAARDQRLASLRGRRTTRIVKIDEIAAGRTRIINIGDSPRRAPR
jgi:hypothetical protein